MESKTYGQIIEQAKIGAELYNSQFLQPEFIADKFKSDFIDIYEIITGSSSQFYLKNCELSPAPEAAGLFKFPREENFIIPEEVGRIRSVSINGDFIKPYTLQDRRCGTFRGYSILEDIKQEEGQEGSVWRSTPYLNIINYQSGSPLIEYYLNPSTLLKDLTEQSLFYFPNLKFFNLLQLELSADFLRLQRKYNEAKEIEAEAAEQRDALIAGLDRDAFKFEQIHNAFNKMPNGGGLLC